MSIFKPVTRKKRDELVILFVGEIMPEKGIDILIKAFIKASRFKRIRRHIALFKQLARSYKNNDNETAESTFVKIRTILGIEPENQNSKVDKKGKNPGQRIKNIIIMSVLILFVYYPFYVIIHLCVLSEKISMIFNKKRK